MVTVYVIQSKTKSKRYVGITNNLTRRLQEHRSKKSNVNRQLGEFRLIMAEEFVDHKAARLREKFLKSGKGREFMKHNSGRDTP